jgi:predicted TIM-barrel fold metal-dependent hydrolase
MKKYLYCLLLCSPATFSPYDCTAQIRIIDMHVHAYADAAFQMPVKDYYGNGGASNAEIHRQETFVAFKKFHIVKAMVCGSPAAVDAWVASDSAHRIIRGIAMDSSTNYGMDSARFEELIKTAKIQVFGEVGAYYGGTTLTDSIWQPYLRLCERYDIPVAVHTGGGDPGGTYSWSPKARLRLGDPYLIEDVLVRYPKLRIYLMHSGEDEYEHALRLMAYYPQLYSDLGAMLWIEPLDQRYVVEFLKAAKQAGYLNRVMFGSDQMRWPYAIEKSIRFLEGLTFLTQKDKADILYSNAARFLRLAD